MSQVLKKIFTKRSLLGTALLLILIGEPTVGGYTALFTPQGVMIFLFLYLTLFHLFESLIFHYQLVIYQVILLTFAIYAVFVTGFLNKELTEYVLNPNLFITLIRIQASFFVAFAFYLLNRISQREEKNILTVKQAVTFFIIFTVFMSFSGAWGIPSILFTFKTVPLLAILFGAAGIVAFWFAFKSHPTPTHFANKKFLYLIYFCILMGAIPHLATFIILVIAMIIGGIYIFFNKTARSHPL